MSWEAMNGKPPRLKQADKARQASKRKIKSNWPTHHHQLDRFAKSTDRPAAPRTCWQGFCHCVLILSEPPSGAGGQKGKKGGLPYPKGSVKDMGSPSLPQYIAYIWANAFCKELNSYRAWFTLARKATVAFVTNRPAETINSSGGVANISPCLVCPWSILVRPGEFGRSNVVSTAENASLWLLF